MLSPRSLLLAQIFAHLGLLTLILFGDLGSWLVALGIYFVTGCLGMTATYHRGLAHKSWKMPRWFKAPVVLLTSLGLTGSAISWVAVHRKHHCFSDSEKDPHSPHHKGFFYCQWLSMFETVEARYVGDLLKEKLFRFQHKYYFAINLWYALILYALDPFLVISAWLAPAAILWNGGSAVVTLGHLIGVSKPESGDSSKNSGILAWLVWGEGWHANHHVSPDRARFAEHWWQWDPGYYSIYFIEKIDSAILALRHILKRPKTLYKRFERL